MLIHEALMIIGSFMIAISWSPQLMTLIRTKSSKNISIPFIAIIITGMILLIPHAIAINDVYFVFLNIAAATIASIVLIFSIKYRKGR